MKKTAALIIIIASVGMCSCKKSYSCECTTTVTFPGKEPHQSSDVQQLSQKTTKKQAEAICKTSEAELTEHLQQQLSNSSITVASSAACNVK